VEIFFEKSNSTNFPKKYTHSVPDHGCCRSIKYHRVDWENGDHPRLYNAHWYFTKWEEDGFIFRAFIRSISLIRNSWTSIVRAEFNYETWFYNQEEGDWEYC